MVLCVTSTHAAAEPSAKPAPKILVLLAQGFNAGEFFGPSAYLRSLGYRLEVASPLQGSVPVDPDGKPNAERDVPVDLPIDRASHDGYAALFVPGGYSPGFLEKDPQAIRVLREFLDAGKPVTMICHGPRLLLKNGLAKGRTLTCLFSVPDELADEWAGRPFGRYLDQAVVRDRNLLTARYPNDVPTFAWQFACQLQPLTGIEARSSGARVVTLRSPQPAFGFTNHQLYLYRTACEAAGMPVAFPNVTDAAAVAKALETDIDLLVVAASPEEFAALPEPTRAALGRVRTVFAHPAVFESWPDRPASVRAFDPADPLALARSILAAADRPPATPRTALPENPPAPEPRPQIPTTSDPSKARAVLALRDGFADEAAIAALRALGELGRTPVLLVAEQPGKVRGVNGLELEATHGYGDAGSPAPGAPIIAPGFFWPQKNSAARQASQPEWIETREAADSAREAWLLAQRTAGHPVVAVGLDSLRLGKRAEFTGLKFATTEQAVWSFPKGAGAYAKEPALLTAPGLVTARGPADLPSALALLPP